MDSAELRKLRAAIASSWKTGRKPICVPLAVVGKPEMWPS
jgi:hypothetical protein